MDVTNITLVNLIQRSSLRLHVLLRLRVLYRTCPPACSPLSFSESQSLHSTFLASAFFIPLRPLTINTPSSSIKGLLYLRSSTVNSIL